MLLEREAQIARLAELLRQTESEGGRVVALLGEAGVGKTTLIEAFAHLVATDVRVLRSACEDLSIPEPLGPLHDLSRATGSALPVSGAPGSRLQLFSQALASFDDPSRPTLVIIEDVHWADDATLDFIRFVGRRIAQTRILLTMTARNDAVGGQRRLRQALADIPAEMVVRIEVPLLSKEAVVLLAADAKLDASKLFDASAGNAFFASELVEAGSADVLPGSVTDAVHRRADRLGSEGRRAIEFAAVFPRQVEATLLLNLLGPGGAQALAECISEGLLVSTAEHLRFRHEIARRAIEAQLSDLHRRTINQQVLNALAGVPATPAMRLFHHARQANDFMALLRLVPQAATEASQVGAHREAAEMITSVLDHPIAETLESRPELLMRLAIELYLIGRTEDALSRLDEARSRFAEAGMILEEGDCLRWISRLEYFNGNRVRAEQHAAAAVDRLSGHPAGPELAMALSNQSQLAMLADAVDDSLRFGRAAISIARHLERPDIESHALNNIGAVQQWVDLGTAMGLLEQSLEIALAGDLQEHVARAYTNLACVSINWRRHAEAEDLLSTGIDYCLERDLDTWRDYMLAWRSELLLRTGRWDEAATVASIVLDNPRATPLARFPATLALARLRIRRGDDAASLFGQLQRFLVKGAELQRLAPYAVLQAEMTWVHRGDKTSAVELLDRAIRLLPNQSLFSELFFWRAKLCGTVASEDCLTAFARPDMPFERSMVLLDGNPVERTEAASILKALGAGAVLQRSYLGPSVTAGPAVRGPGRSTRANPVGLTGRELQILSLISAGLSNKAIANKLAISAKTVDHHVSAVLGKLAVKSRLQAAARARELRLS